MGSQESLGSAGPQDQASINAEMAQLLGAVGTAEGGAPPGGGDEEEDYEDVEDQ